MSIPQFTIEQIENSLDRFANIGVGLCWREHMSYRQAAETVSFALVMMLEYLVVPKTIHSERALKGALQKGMKIYYYPTNFHARDVPTGDAILHFYQK
jgi:hypothetical protein